MKIFVRAKTKARVQRVEQLDALHFYIAVKEIPEKGKANEAIRKALARHFSIPISQVILKSGGASKLKTFIVPD